MHTKALALALLLAASQPGQVAVVDGTQADGSATTLWLDMLARRLPEADYARAAAIKKEYTAEEAAWALLVRERAAGWAAEIPALVELFAPVTPPPHVTVVLGNRGADDAFSHKPVAIGFDLAAMQRVYGNADAPGAGERLDRFFRHEYVHLLQHARWQEHPYEMNTPLKRALAEIWAEGSGNYFSLSGSWQTRDGVASQRTVETLNVLEPRFVARLAALACATPGQAQALTADLSRGRFDRKWGALTPALWLETDTEHGVQALRAFIHAGPEGVWDLAARHLPPALNATLVEARAAAELCGQ